MNVDFRIHFHGTVWQIVAVSERAREFADEHFVIEDWQGTPQAFTTDWRPARNLCRALREQGFQLGNSEEW